MTLNIHITNGCFPKRKFVADFEIAKGVHVEIIEDNGCEKQNENREWALTTACLKHATVLKHIAIDSVLLQAVNN